LNHFRSGNESRPREQHNDDPNHRTCTPAQDGPAQTLDQQNEALDAAGATKTFSDNMSGARDERPGLAALMEYVRQGDTVVVRKLVRLGPNTLHILETVKALTDRGVTPPSALNSTSPDSATAAHRSCT